MKAYQFAALAALIGAIAPAQAAAQSVSDDVRCLLLSNAFGKGSKDEKAKAVAGETMLFYIARLDTRTDAQAITREMRALVSSIDPNTAGQAMNACVARVARAKQRIQSLGTAAQAARKP